MAILKDTDINQTLSKGREMKSNALWQALSGGDYRDFCPFTRGNPQYHPT